MNLRFGRVYRCSLAFRVSEAPDASEAHYKRTHERSGKHGFYVNGFGRPRRERIPNA
ncbi:hypothetical protein Pla52o_03010 [Novipirellula galeiformis]|uniref:Uncharacterized protein n=1 Tax=Novipirellula galeiformis TaxID=2528004 RepID=A0A5C6CQ27_9BACT|nr:hypothetical protein Pla52o_03010 [Novipirellula galeiformis]